MANLFNIKSGAEKVLNGIAQNSIDSNMIINTAVTSGKIDTGAVGSNELATDAVITDKIATGAVTTDELGDGAVTRPKQAAVGQQLSDTCGTFTHNSATPAQITNLSVTITTTGRPVVIMCIPDGVTNSAFSGGSTSTTAFDATVTLKRDSDTIFGHRYVLSGVLNMEVDEPVSNIEFQDVPGAGTYTYTLNIVTDSVSTFKMRHTRLLAYEL